MHHVLSLLLRASLLVVTLAAVAVAQTVTVVPPDCDFILEPGETQDVTVTVCVPGQTVPVDIYLLGDTTTSMAPVLDEIKTNASAVVSAIINTPGTDIQIGVGNYRDFPFDPLPFEHQVSVTDDVPSIVGAINTWVAAGGGDGSEGQFYALYQLATDPAIGFRPESKRIIVWFGDSPGHDPVCDIFVGQGTPTFEITEALLTSALQTAGPGGTTVIAIGTSTGYPTALNDDPVISSEDYPFFCTPAGTSGQADRLAAATSGVSTMVNTPAEVSGAILATIAGLLANAEVTLDVTGDIGPFVQGVEPPIHSGLALPAEGEELCVDFVVSLVGAPCANSANVFAGALGLAVNSTPAGSHDVTVTQPSCNNAFGLFWLGKRRIQPPLAIQGADPTDVIQLDVLVELEFPFNEFPDVSVPDDPSLLGFSAVLQCGLFDPFNHPDDPIKVSNGLLVVLGDPQDTGLAWGVSSGLELSLVEPALVPGMLRVNCVVTP